MQSLVIVSHLLLLSLKRKSRYELVLHHSCLLLLSLSGLLFFFFLLCFHENLCLLGDFLNTKITPKIISLERISPQYLFFFSQSEKLRNGFSHQSALTVLS